jgi:predicted phosphodiesterase
MTLASDLDSQRKSSRQAAEIKALKAEVERLEKALSASRKSKLRIPTGKPRKSGKGAYLRVVFGDSHGHHADWRAVNAMLDDFRRLNIRQWVHLGDAIDCGGWLAQHHTLGYVPQAAYSFEDDVAAANQFFDRLQAAAPNADSWLLCGNHDGRIEAEIIKATLGNVKDCEAMLRRWGPEAVLHLEQRGVKFIRRDRHYDGVRTKGTMRLGKCLFTHGTYCGKNAAAKTLSMFKANVCFGHTHLEDMDRQQSACDSVIGAWSFGCLCDAAPLYGHTRPNDWSHGYGLQIVEPSGDFLCIQVPIIDGRSLLHPLALELRAA